MTFTGTGFGAQDTVVITIHEDPHWQDPDRTVTAIADASGNFTNRAFVVDQHDFGVAFTATAVGSPSGRTAQHTFTDGNSTITGTVKSSAAGNPPIAGAIVTCLATGSNPCNNLVADTTDAAGAYSLTVQFSGSSNTVRLTATASGFASAFADVAVSNPTTPNQNFLLTPAGPTKLAFTTPAFTGTVGQCLGPITVQTQNASSTATNVTSNTTVNLTTDNGATGAAAFYSANTCAAPITTISIASGTNSGSFFYKATTRGSGTTYADRRSNRTYVRDAGGDDQQS